MLSWMLLEENGVGFEAVEARRWALAAAAHDIAAAMTRLGMIYHNALAVDRDPTAAAEWWTKAAVRGDVDGQAMLGAAYLLGAGVRRDSVVALAWLLRAQRGGSPLATRFLNGARAGLSVSEIAEAKRANPSRPCRSHRDDRRHRGSHRPRENGACARAHRR
jgi:TPR repeat protein